jgi:tight adherence protein C
VTGLVLAGAVSAAGLLWLAALLLPRRIDPVIALGRFDAAQRGDPGFTLTPGDPTRAGRLAGWQAHIGSRISTGLTGRGITQTALRHDLGLLGRTYESHLGVQALAGLCGGLLAAASTAGMLAAGISVPPAATAALILLVGAVFALLPEADVRRRAAAHRRTFRHALGSFLDLVAMSMAGGRGLDESLISSARTGSAWPFALIAETLQRARAVGERPWTALRALGQRIGVDELTDLAGSVELVAESGSRIRDTLAARASTLRRRQIADSEGKAAEREQSLRIAQLIIGFGFVVFIGYPAVANVLAV